MMNFVHDALCKAAVTAVDPLSKMHKAHYSRIERACQRGTDYISRSVAKLGQKKQQQPFVQPQQGSDCYILQTLDTDAMLCIADYLPPHTRAVLSQTCRAMRNIVPAVASEDLPYVDKANYLANSAKDRLDRWVCQGCVKTHPAHFVDRPFSATSASYHPGIIYSAEEEHLLLFSGRKPYLLTSQHVQLALKYHALRQQGRLPLKQRLYLDAVLKPRLYRDKVRGVDGRKKNVWCAIKPKIVGGRFLLRASWVHDTLGDGEPDTDDVVRLLRRQGEVCCWYDQQYTEVDLPEEEDNSCARCHRCLSRAAAKKALDKQGAEVEGHDLASPTDYAFCVEDSSVATLTAWQDLGSGISPMGLAWGRKRAVEEEEDVDLRFGYGPGEVKKLFEES